MKQNQHRAGGRNNRPAQSKQVRKKTTVKTNGKFLEVELPEPILTAVENAAHAGGTDRNEFIRDAIRQKIATIERAEPDREQVLDRLHDIDRELENHSDRSKGFHFLLVSHLERLATQRVEGCPPSDIESCGVMLIAGDIDEMADEIHRKVHRLQMELGRRDLTEKRLAAPDATAQRVRELQAEIDRLNTNPLAKGGAR